MFWLEWGSSKKENGFLNEYGFEHTNEYDDIVLMQFKAYIDLKYPPKTQRYFDDYFDELDKERESWY